MKLFGYYLKQKWRICLGFAAFCGIFAVTFALYHLPLKAVIYPTGLCAMLAFLIMLLDFFRIKRRHDTLSHIRSLTDVIEGDFPTVETVEDADYRAIITLLAEEHNVYRTATSRRYTDMVDYYTVWAHQIKTPIASMRLNLQNEDSPLARKLTADLGRIEQYVEMVLTFLRLDSESTDYVIKEYDLDAIVRQAVKKFAGEFISRKLTLVYEPLNTSVLTDEKWLSFVIEQLLSNALKYTPSGSITITIDENKWLSITDTGIGIAPEDLPRIFENGYTGYNGRTDKKASGIGLYLCKRICTNLGHTIKAESTIDKGTTVTVDLGREKIMHE